jgi:hypothetical protein
LSIRGKNVETVADIVHGSLRMTRMFLDISIDTVYSAMENTRIFHLPAESILGRLDFDSVSGVPMASHWLDGFFKSEDFASLIRNLTDPEKIVRIASLRAVVRILAMQGPQVTERVLRRLETEIDRHERDQILGVSFLPEANLLKRALKILTSSDEEDKERAVRTLNSIVDQAEAEIGTERAPKAAEEAFKVIVAPLGVSQSRPSGHVEKRVLRRISPKFASYVVTSQFASLAMLDFDDRTETHLAASEGIGRQIQILGRNFRPDISSLFQVYQSFYRHSMRFWLNWLEDRKNAGLNLAHEMPDWFPITQGPLAVTRQIEWAVSRKSLTGVAAELNHELQSSDPRDRWAAANLIEWAARYHWQDDFPRFGGGSGPPDVLTTQAGMQIGLPTSLNIGEREVTIIGGDVNTREVTIGDVNVREVIDDGEPPEGSPRYTDLTIFNEYLYPGDAPSSGTKVDETTPLVVGSPYTVEVAIRLKRTGIGTQFQPPRSVKNPRKDKEDLLIFVLAQSLSPSITIDEAVTKVVWAYNTDSESAYFRLAVKQAGISEGLIEVRLYDNSLDLLDVVQLSVSVAADSRTTNLPPAKVEWLDQGGLGVTVNNPPRLLSIDVVLNPDSSTYRFLFKFLAHGKSVTIPGSSLITAHDIEKLLVKVRDFWTELVITNYSMDLSVTRTTFGKYLIQLRKLGVEAWTLLFGSRYAAEKGAAETIGELLDLLKPQEGAIIQIAYGQIRNFVFPWSIVYPPKVKGVVDPFEFWGARYQIEQVTGGSKRDELSDVPITLAFALDPNFADSDSQKQLLQSYQVTSNAKLNVTDPISGFDPFLLELERAPAAHLYYFYCHGYAPAGESTLNRDGVKLLKERIEAIPEGSAERKALDTLLNLTAKMNDEAWMYIGDCEVKESDIKTGEFFNKKRPIVFLNMCQSADLLPSVSSGLVRLFLGHSASAVIGTESPMTGVFANAFSKEFFDTLFAGEDVGTALWKARRRFLRGDMRNPLGLAYTLYGRAVTRLGGGAIISAGRPANE